MGSLFSSQFMIAPGTSMFYLPIPLGIGLIFLFGPKILIPLYLNAVVSAPLWGLPDWHFWPLYAWPETLEVFLAWWIPRRFCPAATFLGDSRAAIQFVIFGMVVPISIGSVLTQLQLVALGALLPREFPGMLLNGWVGDMFSTLALAPAILLFFGTPQTAYGSWVRLPSDPPRPAIVSEVLAAFFGVALVSLFFPIQDAWWVCVIFVTWAVLRFGLRMAVLANLWCVFLMLIMPRLLQQEQLMAHIQRGHVLIYLDLATLSLVGIMIGKSIEDLRTETRRRRHAEDARRRNEERLRVMIDNLPAGAMLVEGERVFPNRHLSEWIGKTPGESLARADLPSGPWLQKAEPGAAQPRHEILSIERPGGGLRLIEVSGHQVSEGEVWLFDDVTERERVRRELADVDRMKSLALLAGGIAHDFNNLLGGLMGYLELALTHASPGTQVQDYLKKALSPFARAKSLTQRLLTFSKGTQGVKTVVDLKPVLQGTARFSLSGSAIRLRFVFPERLWPCEVDVPQIEQVIENLVLNARQAMRDRGEIEVWAENLVTVPHLPPGPYVRIGVRDEGPGIAPDVLARIFEPYFTTKSSGSGLGLATAHAIVRSHGGMLAADSALGEGSCFSLCLPARPQATATADLSPNELHAGSGLVLIVDDDAYVREVLAEMLRQFGYSVLDEADAESGLAAVRRARQRSEDVKLAFLDLTLRGHLARIPEMLVSLRAEMPGIRVVATSGYAEDPVMTEPDAWGFSAALPKPFRMRSLADLLEQL